MSNLGYKIFYHAIMNKLNYTTKKRNVILLASIVVISAIILYAFNQDVKSPNSHETSISIIKGPYLQNVTQNSISIMWETNETTPGRVEYGLNPVQITSPYNVKIHEVTITGLVPSTFYNYRVSIDGSNASWTNWFTFLTAPSDNQSFRIAVYGDTRTYPSDHSKVVRAIMDNNPEIVFNVGDLVENGRCLDEWGVQFFSPAAPLMGNITLFPVLGNHEYRMSDRCTTNQKMWYYDFFSLPGNEQWYALTYGNVRFIILDTNDDFSHGSAQYKWLVNELESSEYNDSKWQFVFFHYPPYTSSGRLSNEYVQNYLVTLFEQFDVDIVFSGHNHNYERSYKDGIYYIVTGGGGANLMDFHNNGLLYNPYSQVRVKNYHHVTLDITQQHVLLNAWLNDGRVIDTFRIDNTLNSIEIT